MAKIDVRKKSTAPFGTVLFSGFRETKLVFSVYLILAIRMIFLLASFVKLR